MHIKGGSILLLFSSLQEGQLSRRESMNEGYKQQTYIEQQQKQHQRQARTESFRDANGYLSLARQPMDSSQSECGIRIGKISFFVYNVICKQIAFAEEEDVPPPSGNVYTSLRARKMAMRRKRSLSVADLPVRGHSAPGRAGTRGCEESGYDSEVSLTIVILKAKPVKKMCPLLYRKPDRVVLAARRAGQSRTMPVNKQLTRPTARKLSEQAGKTRILCLAVQKIPVSRKRTTVPTLAVVKTV